MKSVLKKKTQPNETTSERNSSIKSRENAVCVLQYNDEFSEKSTLMHEQDEHMSSLCNRKCAGIQLQVLYFSTVTKRLRQI